MGPTREGHFLACVINSEAAALLAVMRRNVRWAGAGVRYGPSSSSAADQPDHHLVHSLKSLRRRLFSCPADYLRPFLDVVRSDETGAPITGAALSSVHKLLSLGALGSDAGAALRAVVDAVTACRFEVTDPASEEAVLMRILQVLLACVRSPEAGPALGDRHVCAVVNTCFRVVHQAGTKSELLQRFARHTMHELVRTVFSRLPGLAPTDDSPVDPEMGRIDTNQSFVTEQVENGNGNGNGNAGPLASPQDEALVIEADVPNGDVVVVVEPYGIPCMVEIFQFLCSLLNISENMGMGPPSNPIAFDEDVPLFALGLINSAIELGGSSMCKHSKLLSLVQDELFGNLIQFGLSRSPLIVSMVCSIVLNLYHHLRVELKLQLEAFFSCVILRLMQSRYGASYQQQEVVMEALVDFCRQNNFMVEMYVNMDCDITCSNVFEDLTNLLSKNSFPVNSPLLSIHVIALDGLVAVIQGMADRIGDAVPISQETFDLEEYTPFWMDKCENCSNPNQWVGFVRRRKYLKRRLMMGADHFNRDPKKGLEYLQGIHLLPEKLDPKSVACFFRYTGGLDKNQVGEYLGNHDEFCIQVLYEFARTFDFEKMNLDTALRLFLETFRLPGESQKIQRVLEAFSERYYEQSPHILANKDAALILSYSLIMLNTDQHNVQVKKKMTEEDFIRNNRRINGGNDLPKEFLSELYHSICVNEIRTIPDQGAGLLEMTHSRWTDLIRKSKSTSPYIISNSHPYLDRDMFAIMSGPTVAAISVVFEYAEHEEVLLTCINGFLAVAKISACHHLVDVLDDLVVSLCGFTTLLSMSSDEDQVMAFGDDIRAILATETVFNVANKYGDYIRNGWKNILGCILTLHKLGLLPSHVFGDTADDSDMHLNLAHAKSAPSSLSRSHTPPLSTPRKSYSLMGRFSQLLYLDAEETVSQPTEEELAAQQRALQTIQKCHIDSIFTDSKFLQAESLKHLAKALIRTAGQPQKASISPDDQETAVFCLDLLIAITLKNRDRIALLWQGVYEHIAGIVQSTVMPCPLVEKAVFGLLKICQRLLPYKENLADELLRSLQLVLKLDARVADAYCEHITQEVMHLVKANATHIKSQMGWRTVASLLSITARHPEASEVGFEALTFIMSEGAHLSPANYVLCIEAARQFAESRLGLVDRSIRALDLIAGSMPCLARWSHEAREVGEEAEKISEGIREMWLRLVQSVKKVCVDQREEVRNHAVLSLQRCLVAVEGICLLPSSWMQAFDLAIFPLLDDLLELAQTRSQKDYRNMEATLLHAAKLMSKAFLQSLQELANVSSFCNIWVGVLDRMENCMMAKVRGRRSDKLQELIPELLKNTLLVMKTMGALVKSSTQEEDSLWELTWLHVNRIDQSMQLEVFPLEETEQETAAKQKESGSRVQPESTLSGPLTGSNVGNNSEG